jgi:hypothetical protein
MNMRAVEILAVLYFVLLFFQRKINAGICDKYLFIIKISGET